MRWSRFLADVLLVVAGASPAGAFAPDPRAVEIDVTPAAKVQGAVRQHRDVTAQVPAARLVAWDQFRAVAGSRWIASWDRATGVPSRIWGGSLYFPGASRSPAIA